MARFNDTTELLAAFAAKGGKVRQVAAHATAGISCKDWQHMVRGNSAEVVTDPRGTDEWNREMGFQAEAKIRAGHGSRR